MPIDLSMELATIVEILRLAASGGNEVRRGSADRLNEFEKFSVHGPLFSVRTLL